MAITVTKTPDGNFQFHGRSLNPTADKNRALEPYQKQVHDYGLVLRLLPSEDQMCRIHQQIGNARFVRNRYLDQRIKQYCKDGSTLCVSTYKKEYLPGLKEEHPFLLGSDKFALECALEQVERAYLNFFAGRARFPRFVSRWKPNGNRYSTKYTNGNIRLLTGSDGMPYLHLPKIGAVRFVLPKGRTLQDLQPGGTSILRATVTKVSSGYYEASLCMESVISLPAVMMQVWEKDILGIDLGLKSFCVAGDQTGHVPVANPRWIRLHERRLRRLQKAFARKQYDPKTRTGSSNREKARLKIAKEQKKTANQRKDFHHKLARVLTDSCTVLVCEDLNIKGMLQNRHLAKAVASAGWGDFLVKLQYKMKAAGKRFLKVSRWYASSQTCSACGHKEASVKDLSVRQWTCPDCGTVHDRDGNAAANLVQEGIRLLTDAGVTVLAA